MKADGGALRDWGQLCQHMGEHSQSQHMGEHSQIKGQLCDFGYYFQKSHHQ